MKRKALFLSAAVMLCLMTGCPSSAPKKDPLAKVQGTVTLDKESMTEGEISFGLPGKPPNVLKIANGKFSGEARVGKNKVEISSYRTGPAYEKGGYKSPEPTRENIIPAKYNLESKLAAEVKEGSANEFQFEVTSK